MDYIYSTLQSKYISPYISKETKMSLRKKVIVLNKAEYPPISDFPPKKTKNSEGIFNDYYQVFFKKDNTSLPKLLTINESIDVQQNRNCTFTDPRYPKSLKKNLSKFDKRKQCLNIIESLDDPDKMKYFYESHYDLLINEQNDNKSNQSLIDILMPKIGLVDYNQSHMKLHRYAISTADITLKLKGIDLVLKDLTNSNDQSMTSIKLHLPLSLVPFYYAINHDTFLYLIAKIIKMPSSSGNELDMSSISIDMTLLKNYVNDIISEDKLFSSESIFKNKESYTQSQQSIKYSWLINNRELELEIKPLMIELKAKLTSEFPTKASSSEEKKKLVIRKSISKSLMCYFIKNSYSNWEKPALCYLSSFKLFRKYISYAYGRPMKDNQIIVFIDELNESNSKANILQYSSTKSANDDNSHTKKPNRTTHDPYQNSKSAFNFFMTLKASNFFFKFYSYKVALQIDAFKTKHFSFDISFERMKFLYQLKSKHNIDDIIRKCIIVNKSTETVSCSIELLKGIAFESMEKFFESKDELYLLHSSLKVSLPRIEWEEMVSQKGTHLKEMKGQKYFIKDEIVARLLNVNKSQWPEIFSQFQDELGKEIEKKVIRASHQINTVRNDVHSHPIQGELSKLDKYQKKKSMKNEKN